MAARTRQAFSFRQRTPPPSMGFMAYPYLPHGVQAFFSTLVWSLQTEVELMVLRVHPGTEQGLISGRGLYPLCLLW